MPALSFSGRAALLLLLTTPLLWAAAPPHLRRRPDKLTRILALEDARSAGGGELDRYLRDPDRSLRRRAALAAGRIADPAPVPTLVDLMNDPEPEVRQMSAFAMRLIVETTAVDRLVASLADSDPVVRGRAAEALGRIGDARAAGGVAKLVLAAGPQGAGLVAVRGQDPGHPPDPWLGPRLGPLAPAPLQGA